MKIRYTKTTGQAQFHSDLDTKFLHLSGGMGCIHPDTKTQTSNGTKPFGDITDNDLVLSFLNGKAVWSKCLGAFPKAKGQLYRIVHDAGEFVAYEQHLVFCDDYKYRPVSEIQVGQKVLSVDSLDLHETTSGLCQKELQTNDGHLICRGEGLKCDCSTCRRRYGQQPLFSLIVSRDVYSSQLYAKEFCQTSYPYGNELFCKLMRPSHNRHDLCENLQNKMGFDLQLEVLALALANCNEANTSAQSWLYSQMPLQSTSSVFLSQPTKLFEPSSQSLPLTITKSTIKSIEKLGVDWYWDTHVPGANNYYAEGCFHHNSGKSRALLMKLIQLSLINRNLPGGLVCPSYTEFKRDIHPLFEQIAHENEFNIEFHGQDHYYQVPWSRSAIYVATAERKIRGPNWAYACINELTLIDHNIFMDVVSRVRLLAAKCAQVASCGTPEGISSWVYDKFVKEPMPKSRVVYASTRENAHNLAEGYIEAMESAYDEVNRKAYLDGLWINMVGNLFYYSHSEKNKVKNLPINPYSPFHIGMDFNVDPMSATIWQYDGLKLRGVDEVTLKGMDGGADTRKMARALIHRGYTPEKCIIYPDPAGQARSTKGQPDVEILKQEGFYQIKVKSKAPGMRQRQLNVNNLLDKGVIIYNPDKMPELTKDLEQIEQDKVTLEKVKSDKWRTHHSDGLDYLCDHLFPFSGKRPESRIQQLR